MRMTCRQVHALRENQGQIYKTFKAEFLFHSNKISGSTFTRHQLKSLMENHVIIGPHTIADELETANTLEAFDYVMDSCGKPITKDFLFEIHRIMKKRTRNEEIKAVGVWKVMPNRILGSDIATATASKVEDLMDQIITDWENSSKTVEAIAKFHAVFESIQPFQDGNGRIGRFIILKQCIESDLPLITIDFEDKILYRQTMYLAQSDGKYNEFINFLIKSQHTLDAKLLRYQEKINTLYS